MKSARSTNLLYMDPVYPQWGWCWSERWTTAQSAESQTVKELNDYSSGKNARLSSAGGEISKSYTCHLLNSDQPNSLNNQRPCYPFATLFNPSSPNTCKKLKPPSPRGSAKKANYDSKSIARSSVRDYASSPAVPSYMASTKSAKAKLCQCSPLEMENGTSEKGSTGYARNYFLYQLGQGDIRVPHMQISI